MEVEFLNDFKFGRIKSERVLKIRASEFNKAKTDDDEFYSFSFAVQSFLSSCGIDDLFTGEDYDRVLKCLKGNRGAVYFIFDDSSPLHSAYGVYVQRGKTLFPVRFEDEDDEEFDLYQ